MFGPRGRFTEFCIHYYYYNEVRNQGALHHYQPLCMDCLTRWIMSSTIFNSLERRTVQTGRLQYLALVNVHLWQLPSCTNQQPTQTIIVFSKSTFIKDNYYLCLCRLKTLRRWAQPSRKTLLGLNCGPLTIFCMMEPSQILCKVVMGKTAMLSHSRTGTYSRNRDRTLLLRVKNINFNIIRNCYQHFWIQNKKMKVKMFYSKAD